MSNKLIKGLVATAVLAALSGCGSDNKTTVEPLTCAEAGDACVKFTVLHTNDNHGRFWENKYGEYGMAARKTKIDEIRAEVESEGGTTLLLSGGDINTGVPESDLLFARPDFIGMNLIQYDAMAVGNHEFDNERDVLDMQRELANFPMLAANIYKTETDRDGKESLVRMFDAYKIFDVNGVRIAVIGLTTTDTKAIGNPEFIKDLSFTDPTEEIKKVIAEIKADDKADLIFATTHMGHFQDAAHGSNAPGDVTLARALTEGDLAAVIGGHSQNPVCMENYSEYKAGEACTPDQQNGTYIMQAHEWGKYVGRANFEFFNGELNLASYKLEPINLKVKNEDGVRVLVADAIIQDPTVKEILRQYQDQGQEKLNEEIATVDGKLEGDRSKVRFMQTNMGHFIAEAQQQAYTTEDGAADFAVMNSGGVRASIDGPKVSFRDVLTVQPFDNKVLKVTLSGEDLVKYLGNVASKSINSGAYAQLVDLEMTVDCKASTVAIDAINGTDFDVTKAYSFTIPSFSASGGGDYPNLLDGTTFASAVIYPSLDAVANRKSDADVLKAFFVTEKDVTIVSLGTVLK